MPPLPHGHPFRLLDRVLMVETGRWAVGSRNATGDDPLANRDGQLPPVLLLEAMAQAAGLAASPAGEPPRPALLARVRRFRCRPPIGAGDALLVTARVVRRFGDSVKVHASVRVDTRMRAAAELVLHFPELGSDPS